ncbi:MAG: hypothetical protein PGN25_07245 [Methylorubrum populi]
MSLPDLADAASSGDARPILFGLFADGSGDARFALVGGAEAPPSRGLPGRPRFSPAGDWYGRWAVQPLHGVLAQRPGESGGVCPDDIVVVVRQRPSRGC